MFKLTLETDEPELIKQILTALKPKTYPTLTELDFSARTRNGLVNGGITTVEELVKATEYELLGFKNLGETSIVEIVQKLDKHNLQIAS